MMTRKHFEAIAHCLDANHAPLELVFDFADMCGDENPRFDRQRFIEASTINLQKDLEATTRWLNRETGNA